jgi:hypothetical protein
MLFKVFWVLLQKMMQKTALKSVKPWWTLI